MQAKTSRSESRFCQGGDHEIDFVQRPGTFIEVKRGRATALYLAWFGKTFPRARLEVICRVRGVSLHDFLHGE